jgi:hypothetical protein
VVSVLFIGLKGCLLEPGQGDGFLRAIKIRSAPSSGWEVKPEFSSRKILQHVKNAYGMKILCLDRNRPFRRRTCKEEEVKNLFKSYRDRQTKFSFPLPILILAPEMSLLTGPPDSTGGCQSALVDELGVSPSRYHHTVVHIAITWG